MIDLPAFTPDAKCPKCGSDDLLTTYSANNKHDGYSWQYRRCTEKREHIHRHCRGCQYGWIEATLDSATKGEEDGR